MSWQDKLFFFNKKNKDEDFFLALDIGTEFVKALVFKTDGSLDKGEIIGAGKAHQRRGDMKAAAVADIEGVAKTCQKAIGRAQRMARRQPERVIVGIAGEYVRGAATTVVYEREKPENKIDLAELKNIVQKIQWQTFNKIRQKLAEETNISEIDVKLINAVIVGVKVDGYQITNPLGFQGRELSLSIFNAFAPLVHLGAIESIIQKLKLKLFSIAAEPYAIARSVNLKNKQGFSRGNAIVIDVGGGTTDLALVRNGVIEGVKSLAVGGQAFTQRLAGLLGLSFNQAEEIKLKYSQGEVGKIVKKKITESLKKDLRVWTSGLTLVLEDLAQANSLAPNILLCGGGSFLPGIKKALEDKNWISQTPFSEIPQVSFIEPGDIMGVQDTTETLAGYQDIASMSLASLALELEREKKTTMNSIVKRAVRLMQS